MKKGVHCNVFIVAAPTIVAPLMGVDINSFCTVDQDNDCNANAIFSDVTNLVGIAPNVIRIGDAVVVIVVSGIKGIQYVADRGSQRLACPGCIVVYTQID